MAEPKFVPFPRAKRIKKPWNLPRMSDARLRKLVAVRVTHLRARTDYVYGGSWYTSEWIRAWPRMLTTPPDNSCRVMRDQLLALLVEQLRRAPL